ncbi:MAG: hypothetical protein ACHQX3_00230 [Nitrospirales bacterium]
MTRCTVGRRVRWYSSTEINFLSPR